jgi:hypothetical protein
MFDKSCPECKKFIEYCDCHKPIEERIPTENEIRDYLKIFGRSVNLAFIGGFQSGWYAHQHNLKDFQEITKKEKEVNAGKENQH